MTSVVCDVSQGFILINVNPNPQETLQDYLGGLGHGLEGCPFDEISETCGT